MITSHHPRNQFRDVFQPSFIPQVREMAGPPEERQKQLIYERERAREAVCMIYWKELRKDRQSTNDNVKLF
jgi:hypothetical protein